MKSQTEKLYELLSDGLPHRTDEIMEKVYGSDHLGLARCGARIYDLKKKYGVEITGRKDTVNPSLYWYQMIVQNSPLTIIQQETQKMLTQSPQKTLF